MNSTAPRRHVKRKPARQITRADRDAINLLDGPPRLNDQYYDESRPVNRWLQSPTNVNRNHENGDAARWSPGDEDLAHRDRGRRARDRRPEHHAGRHPAVPARRAPDGELSVSWEYNQEVPNKKLRGTVGGSDWIYDTNFGKGEWVAKTMEDAKQMARDFNEGVS